MLTGGSVTAEAMFGTKNDLYVNTQFLKGINQVGITYQGSLVGKNTDPFTLD